MRVDTLPAQDVAALLEQPFVKDGSKTLGQRVAEVAARTGEAIQIREFCRYQV